jgi:hypothetical protein
LLRRWVFGETLSRAECRALGLPDRPASLRGQTTAEYRQSLPHYAALYGRDVRNIKRWIKDGRACSPPDLPPFDSPREMADWYRRVKRQEPRDNLTRFERDPSAAAASVENKPQPASAPTPAPSTSSAPQPSATVDPISDLPPMQIDMRTGTTADGGLLQIRALVNAQFAQLERALARGLVKEAANLRREWEKSATLQRQWEKDIIKIQEGRGEVLRTREVNTELVQMFTTTGASFFNALLKLIKDLSPEMPAAEQRALALRYRDACYAHLKKTRWASAWSPDLAAPSELALA